MDDQKQQIIEKLKAANNILVTVNTNPTVDQLSACIGLTLLLNKMGKHATAVFSGQVPSTIEFLKPEDTIEKNTDSLRDFIIAIDKSKADKLRYKVEDEVVKIFITPYKSSISEKDLVFSQGDFNVDVVMALGVHQQSDLDAAITAHGRILHDAVVVSVNNTPNGQMGTIHWQDLSASGLSELVGRLAAGLGENLLDQQIATALLTGIVAETEHFGNKKTTPETMTMSATLLAAGANQQLVASELDNPHTKSPAAVDKPAENPDQLKIPHVGNEAKKSEDTSKDSDKPEESIAVDASLEQLLKEADKAIENHSAAPVVEVPEPKPTAGDDLPHIEHVKAYGPAMDLPSAAPEAEHKEEKPAEEPKQAEEPAHDKEKTLSDIESSVNSPHVETPVPEVAPPEPAAQPLPPSDVNSARQAVEDALKTEAGNETPPLDALNAVPVNLDLGHAAPAPEVTPEPAAPTPQDQPGPGMPLVQPQPGLTDYAQTPQSEPGMQPAPTIVTPNTPPAAPGINVPPPQVIPPTSTTSPPGGPPPPPVPPPMPPQNFGTSM